MDIATLPGDPPVEIVLRKSSRARRLSLRVSGADGRVVLSYPARAPRAAALAFAHEREQWLRRALAGLPEVQTVGAGMALPFEGRPLRLVAARLRHARLEEGTLLVPAGRAGGPAAEVFLRAAARARLNPLCRKHAAALGQVPGRIRLRDTRSRWGSCTARGDLMFSWRLILAPPEVLDYVAAHEVAHLVEMNHSPRFWSLVDGLVPGWREQRDWLRRKGAGLHRYRFHDARPRRGSDDDETPCC